MTLSKEFKVRYFVFEPLEMNLLTRYTLQIPNSSCKLLINPHFFIIREKTHKQRMLILIIVSNRICGLYYKCVKEVRPEPVGFCLSKWYFSIVSRDDLTRYGGWNSLKTVFVGHGWCTSVHLKLIISPRLPTHSA